MFYITESTRPNRCELCRWAVKESRYVPVSHRSVADFSNPWVHGFNNTEQCDVLVCKRMPPTPNEQGDGVSPVVGKGNYCGEFESKEGI